MIAGFRHRGLRRLYLRGDGSRIRPDLLDRVRTILAVLEVAENVRELDRHSYKLHRLKGDLEGFWAVTVRANWRIVFRFEGGEARDVDLVDYH